MKTRAQPQAWHVGIVEHLGKGFTFNLSGKDFDFEPRHHCVYSTKEQAISAAYCYIKLLNSISQSLLSFHLCQEIGILKLPKEDYLDHSIWIVVDGGQYSWELRTNGYIIHSDPYVWYGTEYLALAEARRIVDCCQSSVKQPC